MIDKELINNITSQIRDGDIIRSSSFLLSSLVKKYNLKESFTAIHEFLKSKGWSLKLNDTKFIENIKDKSIIDIEKWIDYNLKKI